MGERMFTVSRRHLTVFQSGSSDERSLGSDRRRILVPPNPPALGLFIFVIFAT